MEEFESEAIEELIRLYSDYLIVGLTPEIERRAQEIEGHYLMSSPIVGEATSRAISWISSIYVHKVVPQLTPEKIRSIVESLKARKKELGLEKAAKGVKNRGEKR